MPREELWQRSRSLPLEKRPLEELLKVEALLEAKKPKGRAKREKLYRSLVAVRDAIKKAREDNASVDAATSSRALLMVD